MKHILSCHNKWYLVISVTFMTMMSVLRESDSQDHWRTDPLCEPNSMAPFFYFYRDMVPLKQFTEITNNASIITDYSIEKFTSFVQGFDLSKVWEQMCKDVHRLNGGLCPNTTDLVMPCYDSNQQLVRGKCSPTNAQRGRCRTNVFLNLQSKKSPFDYVLREATKSDKCPGTKHVLPNAKCSDRVCPEDWHACKEKDKKGTEEGSCIRTSLVCTEYSTYQGGSIGNLPSHPANDFCPTQSQRTGKSGCVNPKDLCQQILAPGDMMCTNITQGKDIILYRCTWMDKIGYSKAADSTPSAVKEAKAALPYDFTVRYIPYVNAVSWNVCPEEMNCASRLNENLSKERFCRPVKHTESVADILDRNRCPQEWTHLCINKVKNICLPPDRICNGFHDCEDKSDEDDGGKINCAERSKLPCPLNGWHRCKSGFDRGQCIPPEFVCDGVPDCFDASDEEKEKCPDNCDATDTSPSIECQRKCEELCPVGYWRCRDCRQCVPENAVCNKALACRDFSDEIKNHRNECANNAHCGSFGRCVDHNCDFSCECEEDFTGKYCENDLYDICKESNPCLNGATCEDKPRDYKCHCVFPYTGQNCTTDRFDLQMKECDTEEEQCAIYCNKEGNKYNVSLCVVTKTREYKSWQEFAFAAGCVCHTEIAEEEGIEPLVLIGLGIGSVLLLATTITIVACYMRSQRIEAQRLEEQEQEEEALRARMARRGTKMSFMFLPGQAAAQEAGGPEHTSHGATLGLPGAEVGAPLSRQASIFFTQPQTVAGGDGGDGGEGRREAPVRGRAVRQVESRDSVIVKLGRPSDVVVRRNEQARDEQRGKKMGAEHDAAIHARGSETYLWSTEPQRVEPRNMELPKLRRESKQEIGPYKKSGKLPPLSLAGAGKIAEKPKPVVRPSVDLGSVSVVELAM